MTVLFATHVEAGHVCAGFRLARQLRACGHRVVFASLPGAGQLVRENGFDFVALMNNIVAPVESERSFQDFLAACADGRMDERLRRAAPDVVVCDSMVWYVAFRAIRLGIPVVNLTIGLCSWAAAGLPPAVSGRLPSASAWEPWRVRAEWALLRAQHFFTKRLPSKLWGRYRSPTRMHHLVDVFLTLARQAGIRCEEGKTWRFTDFGPQLILPEIVLSSQAFDFPGGRYGDRCYLGGFPDVAPVAAEQAWGDRPLVYASLGSAPEMYPHSRRFFAAVREASRLRPDWQWVVASGGMKVPAGGENLTVMDWVPQIGLLRKAAVMVTHGGIGSVMECIRHRVPMVIVPGGRDQPGNQARAIFHGIAVGADMPALTGAVLAARVAEAMDSVPLRQALERMASRIDRESEGEDAVDLVVRVAGQCC